MELNAAEIGSGSIQISNRRLVLAIHCKRDLTVEAGALSLRGYGSLDHEPAAVLTEVVALLDAGPAVRACRPGRTSAPAAEAVAGAESGAAGRATSGTDCLRSTGRAGKRAASSFNQAF